jgi:DNA polymerase-3 subunit gamma/tau
LVDGDAGAGIAVLAELDERGRDVAVVLDQILDRVRLDLAAAVGPGGDAGRAAALSAAAHRLAAIDPERRGVGGLRFQVELALLDAATRGLVASPAARARPQTGSSREQSPIPAPSAASPGRAGPAAPPAGRPDSSATDPAPSVAAQSVPPADPVAATPLETATADEPATAAAEPTSRATKRGPATDASAAPGHAAPPSGAPTSARLPAPSGEAASTGIDELRAAWPEIVATLSQSPPVKPLIAACRPVSIDGPVVTLGFPEDQAFLKDALERRRTMLEEGIGRILGRPVSVHCVATNLEHVPPAPLGEAADLISEARRIFADDLVDVGEVS